MMEKKWNLVFAVDLETSQRARMKFRRYLCPRPTTTCHVSKFTVITTITTIIVILQQQDIKQELRSVHRIHAGRVAL
jgi:hypothetical protein